MDTARRSPGQSGALTSSEGRSTTLPASVPPEPRPPSRRTIDTSGNDDAAFTLADMKALRLLAVALGVVLAAMCLVIRERAEMLLAASLITLMMITCPLAIYLRRRRKLRKKTQDP